MYMFPALEEALSVKLPSPTELATSEANKLLSDLCLKHEIECPPPRTSARLLDKVKTKIHIFQHEKVTFYKPKINNILYF